MWFKYFSKESWKLRLWRSYNLKFDANEFGVTKNVYMAQMQSFILKILRTDGPFRGFNVMLAAGVIRIYMWANAEKSAKAALEAEEKEKAQLAVDREDYKTKLFLNRYGAPTRPTQSLEEVLEFALNSAAINDAIEFISVDEAIKHIDDFGRGLDTWMGEEDKKILDYARTFKKESH